VRIFRRVALAVTLIAGLLFPTVAPATAGTTIAQAKQQQNVTISGRVRSSGNVPIGGAGVSIEGNGIRQTAKTDKTGSFSFNVPPGEYTITTNAGGYQSGTTLIAVAAAMPLSIAVTLTEADLSNLQVIGRTSTTTNKNTAKFNISSSAQTSLTQETIEERDTNDLTQLVGELPGVQINTIGGGGNSTSATPNKNFSIDGFQYETKTIIDGHPISSGVFGTFLTQFLDSGLIQSVDVIKGAGLNGATAGQSAIGTINIRTFDFTANDSAFAKAGLDSYGGSFYSALIDKNLLKDNKLSIIVGKSVHGYNGPTAGYYAPNYDYNDSASGPVPTGTYQTNNDSGVINGLFDLSDTYTLSSELAKVRYKFSEATSIQFGFFGAQGRYNPQGGSYSSYEGNVAVAPCTVNNVPQATFATCTSSAVYNAPWASNLIGTTAPGYSFYPGSNVTNNQPNFNAEFHTSIKNDTVFFRPYIAVVNRLVDGSGEVNTPGNDGGWYAVTNVANCTVASTISASSSGPCFTANSPLGSIPYIINPNVPHSFASQSTTVPTCSPTPPYTCFTTPTAISNGGVYAYGTPYNQPELDRLNGYTFTYLHPFQANNVSLQFDHYMDDTQKDEGDQSNPAGFFAGCTETNQGGPNPAVGTLGYQSCVPVGAALPKTPVQIPETVITQSDLSVALQYSLTPKIEFDFGSYYTLYRSFAQIESLSLLSEYGLYKQANPAWAGSTSIAPVEFQGINSTYSHIDPHFGFVFRPDRDITIRLTGGSSISTPYAQQISGLPSLKLANQGQQNGENVLTQPNSTLKPEETVALNLGTDIRLKSGAVFSADFFDDAVHNKWEDFEQPIPTPAGVPQAPNGTVSTQYYNVSLQSAQGVDVVLNSDPAIGFGYYGTVSLLRSYLENLPYALTTNAALTPYDGEQLPGVAYAKGYASIQYKGVKDSLLRLGVEYNGPNNSYFAPAFFMFDATARVRVANRTYLQLSAQNLSNVNLNTYLAEAAYAIGTKPVQEEFSNGVYSYPSSYSQDIYAVPFKTIRASLTYKL